MVDDLTERRKRKLTENFGNLYADSILLESEKPLLARRLRQVMRGFRRSDVMKLRPALIDTPLCDIKQIDRCANELLESEGVLVRASGKDRTISGIHRTSTYERIQALYESVDCHAFNENTVRGLFFLTIVTRAVLYDREAERAVKLWFDAVDDRFILYVNPKNGIDESLDPSIKVMVLARTLGVQLEVTDENEGITCYKLVASAIGEFLYEVRKLDEDDTENESTEEL